MLQMQYANSSELEDFDRFELNWIMRKDMSFIKTYVQDFMFVSYNLIKFVFLKENS